MTVHVFFNPDLVGQLAACGITAQRRLLPGTPTPGFVLGRHGPRARGGHAVTNVVAMHGNVTITGRQLRLPAGEATTPTASTSAAVEPRTALELVEECTRLRRDNQRLSDEVARLRAQVDRLTGPQQQSAVQEIDDSERRFSLLELE